MDSTIFQGCVPALMTPCNNDRTPNDAALVKSAQKLMSAGMNGVVYCGSMGDWPLLSDEQHAQHDLFHHLTWIAPAIAVELASSLASAKQGKRYSAYIPKKEDCNFCGYR